MKWIKAYIDTTPLWLLLLIAANYFSSAAFVAAAFGYALTQLFVLAVMGVIALRVR